MAEYDHEAYMRGLASTTQGHPYAWIPDGLSPKEKVEWFRNLLHRVHRDFLRLQEDCQHVWHWAEDNWSVGICTICGARGRDGSRLFGKPTVIVEVESRHLVHHHFKTIPLEKLP